VDSIGQSLTLLAAHHTARFTGRNARIGQSGTVHAVGVTAWVGGLSVPAPVCRVGMSGGELVRLTATNQPVSCGRCARSLGVTVDPPPTLFDAAFR